MCSVVLVTGGAGFIGSHVVDRLALAGHTPRILDTRPSPWHAPGEVETVIGDVRRPKDVARAMRGCTAVCHLAAAADVGEVHASPAWATELNTTGTLNVLEAAREAGLKRVVYASTVWVYSDVEADRVDEETLLPKPAHVYTAGKLAGELYCHSYGELYGLEPTIVRFGIPYGPRARPAAVIPSFVDCASRGRPLTVGGSGEQERSFVYVEDLAEGVVAALAPQAAGRTYNLAGRETTTIRRLAEIVCDEVAQTEIVHTEGRPGDLRGAVVVSDRAEQELGWRATTPLREGVRRYAAWLEAEAGRALAPAAAPAEPRMPSGLRRARSVVASVAGDPAYVGMAGLVAVAAAVIATLIGTRDVGQAAGVTFTGIAALCPLGILTMSRWPAEYRRAQVVTAALVAAAIVVLVGVLSAGDGAEDATHTSGALLLVTVSVCLSSALQILPRKLAASSASA